MPPSPAPTPAPQMPQMPQNPTASHSQRNVVIGAVSALVLAIALLVGIELARSNADYICTKVIEGESTCSNGSWSSWQTASETTDATQCLITKTERRTYTGTRVLSRTIQYLNLRTQCAGGYSQAMAGEGEGSSGFHGGGVITTSSACQIEETRTSHSRPSASVCTNTTTQLPSTATTRTQTDVGQTSTSEMSISDANELGLFEDELLATSSIKAIPSIVRKGESTRVTWTSEYMRSCVVTGTNGDEWPKLVTVASGGAANVKTENGIDGRGAIGAQQTTQTRPAGLSGDEMSGPINEQTIFTLTCKTPTGLNRTQSVTVDIIPEFQEQ